MDVLKFAKCAQELQWLYVTFTRKANKLCVCVYVCAQLEDKRRVYVCTQKTKDSAKVLAGFLAQFPSSFYQHWAIAWPTNIPTEAADTQIILLYPKTQYCRDKTLPFSLVNSVEVPGNRVKITKYSMSDKESICPKEIMCEPCVGVGWEPQCCGKQEKVGGKQGRSEITSN